MDPDSLGIDSEETALLEAAARVRILKDHDALLRARVDSLVAGELRTQACSEKAEIQNELYKAKKAAHDLGQRLSRTKAQRALVSMKEILHNDARWQDPTLVRAELQQILLEAWRDPTQEEERVRKAEAIVREVSKVKVADPALPKRKPAPRPVVDEAARQTFLEKQRADVDVVEQATREREAAKQRAAERDREEALQRLDSGPRPRIRSDDLLSRPLRVPLKRGVCGKLCFSSERAARANNARARFRIHTYQCDECRGAWHVANADKKEKPLA